MGAIMIVDSHQNTLLTERSLAIFEDKGFSLPKIFSIGNWVVYIYPKQMLSLSNWRSDGEKHLFSVGTPVYGKREYSDTLDEIFSALKESRFDYSLLYGAFALFYWDGFRIRLYLDDMGQYPIYRSINDGVYTSSFLACAAAQAGSLHLNRFAVLEKLCTGMVTGTDTLFSEVSRVAVSGFADTQIPLLLGGNSLPLDLPKSGFDKTIPQSADRQLETLRNHLLQMKSNVALYGADMGLSGGYDSRLLLALLADMDREHLSVHSHQTGDAHNKELIIAQQMASHYNLSVQIVPTVPLWELDVDSIMNELRENMLLFDGCSDSHYGTFGRTYSKEYRKAVSAGKRILFTGLSGEIYRNYRKIVKPVIWRSYLDTYVFFCTVRSPFRTLAVRRRLRAYITRKATYAMGRKPGLFVFPRFVQHYNVCVRLPHKAGCAASAFNQLMLYDAPCSHRAAAVSAAYARYIIGADALLEAEMIRRLNPVLFSLPVTKTDYSYMGVTPFHVELKKRVFALLPMSIIRWRKRKSQSTEDGVSYLKKCPDIQRALDRVQELLGKEINLKALIESSQSYQNALYTCYTIDYLLKY